MHFMKGSCTTLLVLFINIAFSQGIYPVPKKKIIEFGLDSPTPEYFVSNVKKMEKLPFDGVVIHLPPSAGGGNVFDVKAWGKVNADSMNKQLLVLQRLPKSNKLTDNFLVLFGASTMDWFDDADWKKVIEQTRFCARAAKLGHLKGLCWDSEPYSGHSPWTLKEQPGFAKHSFADYYKKVRERGKEFIEAINTEFPKAVILSLRQLSDFGVESKFSTHYNLLAIKDQQFRQDTLPYTRWALVAPFTNGILDGIAPGVTYIDANEDPYYYTSAEEFYRSHHIIRQEALSLIAPEE